MLRRWKSLKASALLALIVATFSSTSSPAFALELVRADPAVNSTVTSTPSAITLTFSSEVTDSGSSLSVRAPSGMAVDDGSLLIDGASALIGLKKLTESGSYTVTYQFMSVDGELITGNYSFTYQAPAAISTPSSNPSATSLPDNGGENPAEATGKSSRTTDILMISLLVISFLVLIFIGRSLRNPQQRNKKRSKKKKK